ncbi:MAG: hypothetical protein GKR96_13915 [Gammaproteobacteria bacterium]|nr:hypothetical protein [Gammaproteobacteria bacterium]
MGKRQEGIQAETLTVLHRHQHTSIPSICDDYDIVEDKFSTDPVNTLSQFIGESGFTPKQQVMEVRA